MHVVTPDGRLVNLNRFDKVKVEEEDGDKAKLIAVRVGATVRPMEPLGRNSLVILVDGTGSAVWEAMQQVIVGFEDGAKVIRL